MAETYMGHIRNDIPYNGIKASYRYKNPGAAYPDSYSKMFGATEFGRIGGNHPIAKFDTFEQGIASNLYKFFTSKKNYLGHSFKEAFTTWSDNPRNAPLYYKNLKYNGQLITDGTIVQREMIYDQQFVKDLWLQVLKIEAAGDTQYLQEMINAFPGAHKLAIDMAKGNPVSFPEPTAPIGEPGTQPTSFRGTGTGSVLGEGGLLGGLFSSGGLFGTQGGLGTLTGSLIGSGAIPTSSISSAISSSLPSSLASLPSASTISSGLAESIQSGQGFTPFTSAVQSIASADTPVGRLSAIGDVATKYEAEIKALVPSLAGLNFKEAIPAIVGLEDQGPTQRLVSTLKTMEGADPDQIVKLGDLLGDTEASVLKLGENWKDKPLSELFNVERYSKEDIGAYRETEQQTKDFFDIPGIGKGYALQAILFSENNEIQKDAILSLMSSIPDDKMPDIEGLEESLPTLLTGSLEEITKTPLVSGLMDGKVGEILTGEESKVKSILTDLGASALTEATGISGDTSKTLLAGGTEEEIKKMRKEIGGIALDGFIESNPTLKGIIDWFYNNQNLITLLGSAGAFAGLSALLGGGIGGGFAAGAGGLLATRLLLGEEGFNQFQGIVQSAAAPVFDFAQKALIDSGLANVPIVGSLLQNILSMGSKNPLAATALISGNVGMAAGLMAGTTGINVVNQGTTMADVMASLTGGDTTSQIQNNLAATGNAPVESMPPGSIDSDGKPGSTDANPSGGTQKGMYVPTSPVVYTDWGCTGMQAIVGGVC